MNYLFRLIWILGLALFLFGSPAHAQLSEDQLAQRKAPGLLGKFKGSYANVALNMGSGTLVTDDYSDNPYLSQELAFFPRFKLTKSMNVRAYWALECEYTDPDSPNGRHCSPSDTRLSFHHNKLWADPWIDGLVMGSFQVWLPSSYASRFNHTVTNLRLSGTYFARLFKGRLELAYTFSTQKYLPTRKVRGFTADDVGSDEDGLAFAHVRSSSAKDGSVGSGGPINDNWMFSNNFYAGFYFTPKLSVSTSFAIFNYLRFSVPDDELIVLGLSNTGRRDYTFGSLDLSYQLHDHVIVAGGISSLQPAKTADNKSFRFPFWDFVSPSNNFSKFYVATTFLF